MFFVFAALAVSACGKKIQDDQPQDIPPMQLVASDIAALQTIDPKGGASVDADGNGAFTAVFGGTDGAAVSKFFSDRVHHLVDPSQAQLLPDHFDNERWLTAPARHSNSDGAAPRSNPQGYKVGALNIGTLFWLEGLVNQVPVSLVQADGSTVPIRSSREGVVILGDGYTSIEKDSKGRAFSIPAGMRQAILLHEARHSDCTGGITDNMLSTLRGLRDSDEFEKTYPTMTCGHLHRVCQSGDLAGMAACDSEAWGAYTVGSIYVLAALRSATQARDIAIYKALFADQIGRVNVDPADLLAGKYGKPDMSHQDYVAQPAQGAQPANP
jgi:hypothetical protein